MKEWQVIYYKTRNYISCKTIKARTSAEAIKKARVKDIIDLYIIKED